MLINLLPTNEKEFLCLEKRYRIIMFFGRILSTALLTLVVLLLIILFFLKIQLVEVKKISLAENQSASAWEMESLKNEVSFANQKLLMINRIRTEQKFSPLVLEDFSRLAPSGVQFFSFFFDGKTQKAALDGHAASRDIFVSFKTALENNPRFSKIDSPLSNLIKSTENNFHISFEVKGK